MGDVFKESTKCKTRVRSWSKMHQSRVAAAFMNCPYCNRVINGWTGLQELQKFRKHLNRCRKNPQNHLTDGKTTVCLGKTFDMNDALNIRHNSGQ